MAYKNGQLLICDRCGATTFCECTGEGERDGGYTRWNKFAPPPEGWGRTSDCKKLFNLCPDCKAEYQKLIDKFEEGRVDLSQNAECLQKQ